MEHIEDITNLSPEDIEYQDYIKRGDDFLRIEIYRHALTWYKKALEVKPDDPTAKEKVNDLEKKIRDERRVYYILLAVAAIAVVVILIVRA